MRTPRAYLLWAVYIAFGGWIISLIVTAGLLTGFVVPLIVSPGLRVIPMGMLILSCMCLVASVVLFARGLTVKTKR